jgi:hypothetical protein
MGSTVCVSCGATLIPYTYCEACQDVLRFICSSCSMITDERIHAYCHNDGTRKLVQIPNSLQIVVNDDRYSYMQNQLNDEIKYSSITHFILGHDI